MTTLEQIIKERRKLTKTGYPDCMTEEDYMFCFKEWLQQKLIETRLSLSLSNESMDSEWINKKELLKELKQ